MALVLTMLLQFIPFVNVSAANETDLYVHKLKYTNGTPTQVQNTGDLMDISNFDGAIPWDPQTGTVEFSLYKLDAGQLPALVVPGTVAQVVEDAALARERKMYKGQALPYGATLVETVAVRDFGSYYGVADFMQVADGYYVLVETTKPATVTDQAAPMFIQLPITNANGDGYKSELHLYPKNVVEEVVFDLTKHQHPFADASASIYEGVVFDLYKDGVLVDGSRQTTSAEGTLSVTGLTVGNYHFVEVSNPDNMPIYEGLNSTSFATNILSFVYNADGTITYPTHSIFSDSSHIVVNYPLPEIAKEQVTTAADNSVDIGETINYKITVQIPHNISEYTSFKVEDFLDKAFLSPNASSIAFSANVTFNPTVNTTFSGSGVAKWLEITFAISDLEALAGQEVEITYSAKLLQAAVAATDYSNRADLPLNYYNINDTPSQSVSVVTYDHKIAKIGKSLFNADNNNIPLAGAEFVIEKLDNGIAVYLVQDAQGEISWDSNMGNATRFETDSFGVVVIHGLGTGDYTAIEVTAPTGYNLPLIPRTNFTVSAHALGTPGETSINNWEIVDLPMTGTIMTAAVVGGLSTLVGTALYFVIVKKDDEDEE